MAGWLDVWMFVHSEFREGWELGIWDGKRKASIMTHGYLSVSYDRMYDPARESNKISKMIMIG